jgi:hypothetical protein
MDIESALTTLGDKIPLATPEGYFISAEHQRIAEIINDYDSDLYLLFIPPAKREPGDKPYAIMHQPPGKAPYIAMYSDTCDERLLARLFENDARRHDILSRLEAEELAQKLTEAKRRQDEADAKADIAKSMWRSPLHTYKHNGKKLDL